MKERPSLTAVVVTYNSADHLEACLACLQTSASDVELTTVVVDNASQDGSAGLARELGAEVIANRQNLGFARAVNQGIAIRPAEYILLLNPDVRLEPHTLEALSMKLKDPAVGAAAPRTVDLAGRQNTAGYYLKSPSLRQVLFFYTRLVPPPLPSWYRCSLYEECNLADSDREVEQVPGACLLTRADVLASVGCFEEAYPIWFEDVDWCRRATKAGYQLWYVASARATHIAGASFGLWSGVGKEVVFYRSMLTFFSRNDPWKAPLVVLTVIVDRVVRLIATRRWYHAEFLVAYLRGSARLPA